ncbi:cyclin-U1-1 [Physcomitrium patens]|uniref:Cyclin n=1 Tax=Physcomitrium patens TaxID=3218 RepID=A0A2K1IFQ6_PHYPA|nr:cyclin-U1-1-like [Physcomitrium patens]PNR28106.1 hypothetical protein PHYPA_028698 [Physcomitrium patens]|eukprot:XP_024363913.1 cyclin-U1-1-like [Physcomitrella patens]
MPPACSVPALLVENGSTGEDGVLHADVLRMHSNGSHPKSVGKGSSKDSSSLTFGTTTDNDEERVTASEREIPKVITVLASVLDRLVARNEQFANTPSQPGVFNSKKLTIFHGLRAPSISIAKYLERIFKYTNCSASCFVVGYVFIDRLIHRQPDLLVTSLNVHRLLVTSVMVATKILDDVHFNNAFFARVGGVSVGELNRLELEFLFRLDFRLTVTVSIFESYCSYLEKEVMATEKKIERVERRLPAFDSASTSPGGKSPVHWKRSSPGRQRESLDSNQLQTEYHQTFARIMARDSPPSC